MPRQGRVISVRTGYTTVKSNLTKHTIPGIHATHAKTVTVLSISPIEEDHVALRRIFRPSGWAACADLKWKLQSKPTVESALTALRGDSYPLDVSECDLLPGSWRAMLAETAILPDPPLLAVTSRLADERLWAEALNLGAYDVLAEAV